MTCVRLRAHNAQIQSTKQWHLVKILSVIRDIKDEWLSHITYDNKMNSWLPSDVAITNLLHHQNHPIQRAQQASYNQNKRSGFTNLCLHPAPTFSSLPLIDTSPQYRPGFEKTASPRIPISTFQQISPVQGGQYNNCLQQTCRVFFPLLN